MLPPKSRPRFLPTLTQVVSESELLHLGEDMERDLECPQLNGHATNVQDVTELLLPQLIREMRQDLQDHIDTQLHQLETKLRGELAALARHRLDDGQIPPNA